MWIQTLEQRAEAKREKNGWRLSVVYIEGIGASGLMHRVVIQLLTCPQGPPVN